MIRVEKAVLGGIMSVCSRAKFAIVAVLVLSVTAVLSGKASAQIQQSESSTIVLPIGPTLQIFSADEVNSYLATKGYTYPPFLANTQVPETMPSRTLRFVRLYNPEAGSRQTGRFIMRAEFVRGLTPQQLKERFALPSLPTQITLVEMPANFAPLLTGIAGPIPQYGPGGGQQSYIVGDQYPFPVSAFIHPQLLTTQAMAYSPAAGGGNAGRVASYLDGFIPVPYSDLEGVYDRLDFLNWSDFGSAPIRGAMGQLSPEPFDAFAHIAVRNSLLFGGALLQRGQYSQQAMNDPGATSIGKVCLARMAARRNTLAEADARSASNLPEGVDIWLTGSGEFGDQQGSTERTGFNYRTGGPILGVDYHFRENYFLGLGMAYLRTGMDWENDRGNADMDSTSFGLYGGYNGPEFFVESALTGGISWMSARRHINFLDLSRTAMSSFTGHDVSFQVRGGANINKWGWEISPMAELGYFRFSQGSFEEHGADSLDLNVGSRDAETFRSELKIRFMRSFAVRKEMKITPLVDIGWAHQIPLDNGGITASLPDIGSGFTTQGADFPVDSCLVGAGLALGVTDHLTSYAYYGGELDGSLSAHSLSVGLRYRF
jgi:outer membrane autotransporter protein